MQKLIWLYVGWLQALIATSGSLYFSEILHFVPCTLCWYQRILMYPLVIILGLALFKKDDRIYQYVLPIAILGIFIAFYHNLITKKLVPPIATPCTTGVSCTTTYWQAFGFINIPLLSLAAFLVITFCMIMLSRTHKNTQ